MSMRTGGDSLWTTRSTPTTLPGSGSPLEVTPLLGQLNAVLFSSNMSLLKEHVIIIIIVLLFFFNFVL